jgi:hypothetical protein
MQQNVLHGESLWLAFLCHAPELSGDSSCGRCPAPDSLEEGRKGSGDTEASLECVPASEEVKQVRKQVVTGNLSKCILIIFNNINESAG